MILVTGATGFVGRHLVPALSAAGRDARGLTRGIDAARRRWPERSFVVGDISDEGSLRAAAAGCDTAFFLVHGMGDGDPDYRRREVDNASRFARVAAEAGVSRIVYLGGPAPEGSPSEHLRSRLEVGEVLRAGVVPAVELRASMIVGHGSLSWLIVRDLAARLPFMVLPRWMSSRTQPVAIDDVVAALVGATTLPLPASAWFDIPGPGTLSGQEILEVTAEVMGLGRPRMVRVPLVSPRLSSHWVRLVTRAQWSVARELVLGLAHDLVSHDDRYWQQIGHASRIDFPEAARRALAAERADGPISGPWGAVERMRRSDV